MREPATSCTDCGKALLPADVLYTPSAAIVCEGCLRPSGPRPAPARPRTRLDRRRSLRRWALLFGGLALSAGYVSHVARAQLRAARTMASIVTPAAGAAISRRLDVRGHVAADAITRPLWLVARGPRPCAAPVRVPVVADRHGDFDAAVNLDQLAAGAVRLSVVSVDERAGDLFEAPPAVRPHGFSTEDCRLATELPAGTLVLTTIDVALPQS